MKMVVVDPICNFASAKASEWVPIRVGTDAALALGMCNVLVNDLGIYDGPYLQAKTNAPYLIGPDKLYVRHAENKKPLVWDNRSNTARPYDEVQAYFHRMLPSDAALFNDFHAQLVRLGKEFCRPRPRCGECPLRRVCRRRGVPRDQR